MSDNWSELLEADLLEISEVMSSVTLSREKLLPGERREVAVIFIDLHGFTAMSEELDHETVHRLSSGIMRALSRTIEAHGGYLDKYEGDKIMALFGAIKAHTDDCERAVSAGMRMLEIIDEIRGILDEKNVSIGARVGISYGPVTVAPDPSGHLTATGDEVNVASRMESMANVGTVLVTKTVKDRCGDSFQWMDLGEREVRGRKRPVHSFQPTGLGKDQLLRKRISSDLSWRFINRRKELDALRSVFPTSESIVPGSSMLLLRGFDGVGKTRLAQEFASGLKPRNIRILRGETSPYAQKAFQLWISALSGFAGSNTGANSLQVSRLFHGLDIESDLRDCIQDLLGIQQWGKAQNMSPLLLRETQVSSLASLMVAMARNSPEGKLLVLADNLQWTDSFSVEVMKRLLSTEDEKCQILIVGCFTPTGSSEIDVLESVREKFPDKVRIMNIEPLSGDSTLQLIETILASRGNSTIHSIPELLLERIFSRSSGNPFITVELVKLLIETGMLVHKDSQWNLMNREWDQILPDSVKGLIRCRIDSLSHPERRVLQMVALVGKQFDLELILLVIGQLAPDLIQSVNKSLSTLIDEGILLEIPFEGGRGYEFASAMYMEMALATVLRQNRIAIHKVTAEQIAELHAEDRGRFSRDISIHWKAAERLDKALEVGLESLDYLTETYQNDECLAFAELMENWIEADQQDFFDDAIMGILMKRQKIQYRLACFSEMEITLIRQLELGKARGNSVELGKTYCSLGELRRMQRNPEKAEEYLKQAIEYSRLGGDKRTLGMSLSNLGALFHDTGESDRARDCFHEAIIVQEECGNLQSAGIAMMNLAAMLIKDGEEDNGKSLLDRSLTLFRKTSFKTGEAYALSNLGMLAETAGRGEEALELLRRAAELHVETGYRHGLAAVLVSMGRLQMSHTSLEEAQRTLLSALDIYSEVTDHDSMASALVSLASIAMQKGKLEESTHWCSEAQKLISEHGQSMKPETVRFVEELISELKNGDGGYLLIDGK